MSSYSTNWRTALNLRDQHDDQVRRIETEAMIRAAIVRVALRNDLPLRPGVPEEFRCTR